MLTGSFYDPSRFVSTPGVVCWRIFERSELRKHSDVGLVTSGQRSLWFPFNLSIRKPPGFSRGVAYLSIRAHYSSLSPYMLLAIADQRVAQTLSERAKPRLVVPPLEQPLAENRLTNLL